MGSLGAALKNNERGFMEAALILSTTEESEMNIESLKKLSNTELLDLYNDMTAQAVKRFATRAVAEKRLEQAAREAGKWDGGDAKDSESATPAGDKSKPAKKVAPAHTGKPPKAVKEPKPAKVAKEPKPSGRPKADKLYKKFADNSKVYNPKKLTLQENSARNLVFSEVFNACCANGNEGVTKSQIEKSLAGNDKLNVAATLQFLVRYKFIQVEEV